MSSLKNKSMESKFNDLKIAIKEDRGRWPDAQGANALIVVYPPEEENDYLKRVNKEYSGEYIIDLSDLFIDYIDKYGGIDNVKTIYKNYRSTSVFSDEDSKNENFKKIIIGEIGKAVEKNKMPIIIRSGILYGTGIRNKHILESDVVRESKKPLLVFYPGEVREDINENEKVFFLNAMKANDYRGQLI